MLKQPGEPANKERLSVLVTLGGGFQGLTIIKGLRRCPEIRVILADSAPENVGKYFSDSFYTVPQVTEEDAFISSLLEICGRESVRLVIPSTNIELSVLSRRLPQFSASGISVAVSEPEILELMLNKRRFYTYLAEHGFPVLPTLDISDPALEFPVIGKPHMSWGGQGIIICRSREDLESHDIHELKKEYVWQPFLSGFIEYSIDCAIDFSGKVSGVFVRRRTKTIGGFAAITESSFHPDVESLATSLITQLAGEDARGILNLQILELDDRRFVSDINPRAGTSSVFWYEGGVNFPLFICHSVDSRIPSLSAPLRTGEAGLSMVRYLDEFWIHRRTGIRAIVFDLDDTLLDQKAWIYGKLALLCREFPNHIPDTAEFLLHAAMILEQGNRSNLFDALGCELSWTESVKRTMIKAYKETIPAGTALYPDVIPVLENLKRTGLTLVLLTDNPPESQRQKIRAHQLEPYFDHIIFSRELGCEKPVGKAFAEAVSRTGERPEAIAMAGDHLYKDIFGALRFGFGAAYWIARPGTFFNFDQSLFENVTDLGGRFVKTDTLRYLLWSLDSTEGMEA